MIKELQHCSKARASISFLFIWAQSAFKEICRQLAVTVM